MVILMKFTFSLIFFSLFLFSGLFAQDTESLESTPNPGPTATPMSRIQKARAAQQKRLEEQEKDRMKNQYDLEEEDLADEEE